MVTMRDRKERRKWRSMYSKTFPDKEGVLREIEGVIEGVVGRNLQKEMTKIGQARRKLKYRTIFKIESQGRAKKLKVTLRPGSDYHYFDKLIDQLEGIRRKHIY